MALDTVLERLGENSDVGMQGGMAAVGHRVVHGGTLSKSMRVRPAVLAAIEKAAIFAPLHNPANAQGIRAAQALFGDSTPQARQSLAPKTENPIMTDSDILSRPQYFWCSCTMYSFGHQRTGTKHEVKKDM